MSSRRFRFDIRQSGRPILIVFLVVLALDVAFWTLLVRPRVQAYEDLITNSEPRRQALAARETAVEERAGYLAGLEKNRDDLVALRKDVLSTRNRRLIEVQHELARLARQFKINLTRINSDTDYLAAEALEHFVMVVPLEGTYANLRQFIQAVEQSSNFLVIEQVAIAEGNEGGVLLQLNITLGTYFDSPELRRKTRPSRHVDEGEA